VISTDASEAATGGRLQDGGDQVGIRWQRQELAGAFANGASCRLYIFTSATGHHRHCDALSRKRTHHRAHIMRQIAQHKVDAPVGAQPRQPGIGAICLVKLRAPRDRNPCGLSQLASQGANDQNAHCRGLTLSDRS
jgi:hypothetical protein